MLKKFFLFYIICGAILYSAYYFVISGNCEEFILSHEEACWASGSLYYLGNLFLIIQSPNRAEEIYSRIIEIFPDSDYYEGASYKYFQIAADGKRKKEALKRGVFFLEEFPDSPKTEKVKKRLEILSYS